MAPRGINTWRRPHTAIYNDNYRYGTNLYSGTLSDIQKKYTDSISRTQLRSDRPDLNLSTFAGSSLGSSSMHAAGGIESSSTNPVSSSPLPNPTSTYRGSVFESMLNSALHSSYVPLDVGEKVVEEKRSPAPTPLSRNISEHLQSASAKSNEAPQMRPTSLYDDSCFFTTPKKMTTTAATTTTTAVSSETTTDVKEVSDNFSKKKRTAVIREAPSPVAPSPHQQDGPSPAYWKDKCRDLQYQVDELSQAMADMSSKLKGELSSLKSKLHTEMTDMHSSLEHTSQQNNELQKTIKRQANQLMEMQNSYEDLQRHLQDSLDEIGGYQRRSQTLRKEMDRLRMEVDETIERGRV